MNDFTLYEGDAREVLANIESGTVQTIVTSPPYYGLRDYGIDGQIGLEETLDEYVSKLVAVFREARRTLTEDGTLWLNLGDAYAGSWGAQSRTDEPVDGISGRQIEAHPKRTRTGSLDRYPTGLKPKDLIGIPWRVAFALQADGWYLRSDIIWAKPNPMPESVTDRPTKAHEYIFLLSKSQRYKYNAEAIREPASWDPNDTKMPDGWDTGSGGHGSFHRNGREAGKRVRRSDKQRGHSRRHAGFNDRWDAMSKAEQASHGRNKRSVWTVATRPFSEAHFATYPVDLIRPCILAGSSPGDTVLDPFNGAGTTGVASLELGRRYVGVELNPEYVQLSLKRLAPLIMQPRILEPTL